MESKIMNIDLFNKNTTASPPCNRTGCLNQKCTYAWIYGNQEA